MKNKYINFVLTGDEKFVMPLSVSMSSILLNLSKDRTARFFLFTSGFTEENIKKIEEIRSIRDCEIVNVPMEAYLHHFEDIDTSTMVLDYTTIATYFRLLMLDILPDDVDKSFYIDGDIVVDCDLSQIYDELSEDKLASVVVEILAMKDRENTLNHCYQIADFEGFVDNPFVRPYFNAGFFLLNIKMSKELHLFNNAFDFLSRYPNPPYADQDTLNAIIGQAHFDKLIYLHPAYNVFCNIHYQFPYDNAYYDNNIIVEAFEHPKVYHYAGSNKPWINRESVHFYDIWWKYCRNSPFKALEEPPISIKKSSVNNVNDSYIVEKKYIAGVVPYLKIKKNSRRRRYYLFSVIPFHVVRIKKDVERHYLFGFLRIMKKRVNNFK